MNIFPELKLSDTEITIIHASLTNTAVQKYFHMLAYNIGKDIVGGNRAPGQTAEEYLCLEAGFKGRLAVLDTLLSITRPESAPPQD